MSALTYRGKASTGAKDPLTKVQADALLTSGLARSYVDNKVASSVSPLALKNYVDSKDTGFTSTSYYQQQDGLLIPNSQKAAAGGVASLDSGTKIPAAQIPGLGDGSWKGPWGPSSRTAQNVTTTSQFLKIAQWDIGVQNINSYWPLVFMNVFVNGSNNSTTPAKETKAIIEVCHGSTYSTSTIVATGFSLGFYGFRPVIVMPAISTGSTPATSFAGTTNTVLTAWLSTPFSDSTVAVTDGGFVEGAAFLVKVT